ncbi:MAG: SDR family oxidoreductase [Myxococcota bacterium]
MTTPVSVPEGMPGVTELAAIRGARILVLGATGAVGSVVVESCLALGAEVIASARTRTRLDELRANLGQHDRLEVAECDATDPAGVEALFEAVSRKREVSNIVHCIGGFQFGPIKELETDAAQRLIDLNLVSALWVLRAALRRMPARLRAVVITGARATTPEANFALYGAAKAAVTHLVEAVAQEAMSVGGRVNAILPGVIDTPTNRRAMPDADPEGWVSPLRIAKAVVWLLTDAADGLNGAHLRMPDSGA